MRRFYREVAVSDGGEILLDGRPVRTPGRRPLILDRPALAEAIAEEWRAQSERIDARSMRMTGLAFAAIDRVSPDAPSFARGLAAYGETDLLCYRAEGPAGLVRRQDELWDPILAWARRRYDVRFELVRGMIHKPQPSATIERLAAAVIARNPFELAGLSPLVTVSGSLVVALALAERAISIEEGWAAGSLDESWQIETWGHDDEAAKALAGRRADFEAGARFLGLLS